MRLLRIFLALAVTLGVAHEVRAQATPSTTGAVEQYLMNPHGEVDGFLLTDGTVVKFPPHLSATLVSTVPVGDEVRVVGFFGPVTPQGRAVRALSIEDTTSGQALVDQPPTTPPEPPEMRGLTLSALSVSGTVKRFLVNDHGDIDTLLLNGGAQVKLRPQEGALVATLLAQHAGETVQVAGVGTQNRFGTVVDANSLSIGGKKSLSLRARLPDPQDPHSAQTPPLRPRWRPNPSGEDHSVPRIPWRVAARSPRSMGSGVLR